jgi:hypothetical protein
LKMRSLLHIFCRAEYLDQISQNLGLQCNPYVHKTNALITNVRTLVSLVVITYHLPTKPTNIIRADYKRLRVPCVVFVLWTCFSKKKVYFQTDKNYGDTL